MSGDFCPPTSPCGLLSSIFVLIFVFVVILFLNNIQFDWIEADDLQLHSTFLAFHGLAFIGISINVDVGFTFGTCSGRHCSPPKKVLVARNLAARRKICNRIIRAAARSALFQLKNELLGICMRGVARIIYRR